MFTIQKLDIYCRQGKTVEPEEETLFYFDQI